MYLPLWVENLFLMLLGKFNSRKQIKNNNKIQKLHSENSICSAQTTVTERLM